MTMTRNGETEGPETGDFNLTTYYEEIYKNEMTCNIQHKAIKVCYNRRRPTHTKTATDTKVTRKNNRTIEDHLHVSTTSLLKRLTQRHMPQAYPGIHFYILAFFPRQTNAGDLHNKTHNTQEADQKPPGSKAPRADARNIHITTLNTGASQPNV